ncbi:hypothetical protein EJ06DRAFT_531505 [Trichodelitschia bisporula]|uniref:Uncharacterized protein n=1 Tax=Trichodelitschia bisporula TaxID=703511 RepID=A0A6G1HT31_9PEZI|nr:hypothetical protein EJ06DRAFT_531505 [Trichodelitschia bisporula]
MRDGRYALVPRRRVRREGEMNPITGSVVGLAGCRHIGDGERGSAQSRNAGMKYVNGSQGADRQHAN